MSIRIIIADDHAIVRHGTAFLIKDTFPQAEILQSEDFAGTLQLLREQSVDLLICDINMPGGESINTINTLRQLQPRLRILIFSAYKEDLYAIRYIKAGANGYLNKNCSEQEIKLALLSVMEKGKYISQHMSHQLMEDIYGRSEKIQQSKVKELSNRETEVASLLIKGLGILEISNYLNIQMSTASTYKSRLYEKLGIDNLPDLITLFNAREVPYSS